MKKTWTFYPLWLLPLVIATGCPITDTENNSPPETSMPAEKQTQHGAAVPDALMQEIRADLAGRTGASADRIGVQRAELVVFNDGSLGCPEPGQAYTQALVDGYWIVLEHAGERFDYRATRRGFFKLCIDGKPPTRRDNRT